METIKSITVLEDAMETVNQSLQEAAHGGDLDAMDAMGHTMVDMAKAVAGLYNTIGLASSMEKLHALAMNVKDGKTVPPEELAGACIMPLPFMANKPPETNGQI